MNEIKFQVISDVHLEFYSTYPKIKPLTKYLFLAGDIGTIKDVKDMRIEKFLSYCSKNWEKTFYVLGNHEYYQEFGKKNILTFEELEEKYKNICAKFDNIHLLSDSCIEIDKGLNVYGTTLWTCNFGYPYDLSDVFNDYNNIFIKSSENSKQLLNKNYIDIKSKNQFNKLKNYLDNLNNSKTKSIILTHFPPIRKGSSNPKYSNQEEYISNYFSFENIYLKLNHSNIVCWISGHTHYSYDIKQDKINFISNQMGYKIECLKHENNFEPDKIFELNY